MSQIDPFGPLNVSINVTWEDFRKAMERAIAGMNAFNESVGASFFALVGSMTPVQREEYMALIAAGVPYLDAYRTASKPGRWFVRRG